MENKWNIQGQYFDKPIEALLKGPSMFSENDDLKNRRRYSELEKEAEDRKRLKRQFIRSLDLRKITSISSLYSTDKLSFQSFTILNFRLQLPISPPFPLIIKEPYSSSYSFHFLHLSFMGIMKKAISSQDMTNPTVFLRVVFSPIRSRTSSLVAFSHI